MNNRLKSLLWVSVAAAVIALVTTTRISPFSQPSYSYGDTRQEEMRYSAFLEDVKGARVDSVLLQGDMIYGVRKDKTEFKTYNPETDYTALIATLVKNEVAIEGRPPRQPSVLGQVLTQALGLAVLVAVLYGARLSGSSLWGGAPSASVKAPRQFPAIGIPQDSAAERATGTLAAAIHEGGRAQLIELQALVDPVPSGAPCRNGQGLDAGRIAMLVAVLSQHSQQGLRGHDIFASTVGGLEVRDPGADLPLLLALASSSRGQALPARLLAFGEVDLAGEVRAVLHGEERLRIAQKRGFEVAIVPQGNAPKRPLPGLKVIAVSKVNEALAAAFTLRATGTGVAA